MKKKKLMMMGVIIMTASMITAFRGYTAKTESSDIIKIQQAVTEEYDENQENNTLGDVALAAGEGRIGYEVSTAQYGKRSLGDVLSEEEFENTEETQNYVEVQSQTIEDVQNIRLIKYGVDQTIETAKYGEDKENIPVIATVNNFVNIRSFPNEESDVVGKLYDQSVGTLLKNEGEWMYIHSGSVTGYVKAEYVVIGEEAQVLADQAGVRLAKVRTTTLKVRTEPTTDASVLGLVPEGDILSVIEETDGFVKISIEEGEGYVSTDFVEVYTENVVAESREEEERRLEKERLEREQAEAAARKALEEQKRQQEAARKAAEAEKAAAAKKAAEQAAKVQASANKTSGNTGTASKTPQSVQTGENKDSATDQSTGTSKTEATDSSSGTNTALGQSIVNYAVQFVGNPYVYGGTSLTNGIDCSGFVMKVYQKFGINLPRTSGEQGASGTKVNGLANAQPGDLIWYSGHIGIYMGNGQIVHASNAKDGIKISNASYRTILGIRRII